MWFDIEELSGMHISGREQKRSHIQRIAVRIRERTRKVALILVGMIDNEQKYIVGKYRRCNVQIRLRRTEGICQ